MVSSKIALTTNGTWSRELSSSWSATVVFGCTIPPCREIRDQQIDCVIHNKEINLSLFIYKEDNQPGLRMHNMNQLTQSQLWCDGKPQHSKYQQVLLPFLCLGRGELVQHSHCMQSPKDKTIVMKIMFHVSFSVTHISQSREAFLYSLNFYWIWEGVANMLQFLVSGAVWYK